MQSDFEITLFKQMSDEQLDASAIETAEQSRRITLSLLQHLNEIERRHLFSKFSVSSLHAYCVARLKMDEAAAGRHVSAARLLREIPLIQEKISKGSMSLTSVAQAGVFFRREAQSGNAFAPEEKREFVMELENKSTREVDRLLIAKSSTPEIHFKEKVIPKSATTTEVRLHLDEETMSMIERLKEIWSHALPNATIADVLKRATVEAVEKHDPVKRRERAEKRKFTPAPESKASVRRSIWKRDGSQCTFVDSATRQRCKAKHFVEEDHIVPKAMGGEYSYQNIRLRCRSHNHRHAIDCYGNEKMRAHRDSVH